MRILLQRVTRGSVDVEGRTVARIGAGLVLLIGVGHADTPAHADRLAEKIAHLRVFPDDQGRFNRSIIDARAAALVVSQFTLYADARKGRRPSFTAAAAPDAAAPLIDHFADALRRYGIADVQTGVFGAHMNVAIHNDGPVTLWLDSNELGVR